MGFGVGPKRRSSGGAAGLTEGEKWEKIWIKLGKKLVLRMGIKRRSSRGLKIGGNWEKNWIRDGIQQEEE